MTAVLVSAGAAICEFRSDGLAPAGRRMRAILRARIVDELTGLGVAGRPSVTTPLAGLLPRIAANGLVGLVGDPGRRFPDLAASPAEIEIDLGARRYLGRRLAATLGPFSVGLGDPADFPDHFAALDLGDVELHRAPVTVSGRVMRELGATRTPLAGAEVAISGIWSREPGPDDDAALLVEPPDVLSLSPGLYRERPAATNALADRAIAVAAAEKRLVEPVAAGAAVLLLSDRVGLVVGGLLALDAGDPGAAELIEIASIAGGLAPDEPAEVTLAYPLARARRAGDRAAPASAGAGGAAAALLRDGLPGDVTAHLAAIAASVPDLGVVEIAGDGATEYQTVRRYRTLTDAGGGYRLPPLSRAARITVTANRADFAQPLVATVAPDYEAGEQVLDFLLRS